MIIITNINTSFSKNVHLFLTFLFTPGTQISLFDIAQEFQISETK